jgi:hypothetical protein
VLHELLHRVQPLLAVSAARNDDAAAALRYARRIFDERTEDVFDELQLSLLQTFFDRHD